MEEVRLDELAQRLENFLKAVEEGRSFIITRDGRPVAQLVSLGNARVLTPEQRAARKRARERMRRGFDLGGGKFVRDDLYVR